MSVGQVLYTCCPSGLGQLLVFIKSTRPFVATSVPRWNRRCGRITFVPFGTLMCSEIDDIQVITKTGGSGAESVLCDALTFTGEKYR